MVTNLFRSAVDSTSAVNEIVKALLRVYYSSQHEQPDNGAPRGTMGWREAQR